jgi:hypothetical protein
MERNAASGFEKSQAATGREEQFYPAPARKQPACEASALPLRCRQDIRPPKHSVKSNNRSPAWRSAPSESAWEIVDDLPEVVAVTQGEVEAIEAFLALLSDPFGDIQ